MHSTTHLIAIVLLNMIVTLIIWSSVYEMKADPLLYNMLLDLDAQFTTGYTFLDGSLNGLGLICFFAVLSFVLIGCIHRKSKKQIIAYVHLSFVFMVITLPATVIKDLLTKLTFGLDSASGIFLISFVSTGYAIIALKAFFTDNLPTTFRQVFAVLNCSFTSVYLLRLLPRHSIWFILAYLVLWDVFALSTRGLLKTALCNAHDYDADILRFFAITATDEDEGEVEEELIYEEVDYIAVERDEFKTSPSASISNGEDIATAVDDSGHASIEEEPNEPGMERTAYDALYSNLILLGMGDLVVYGSMIGKFATIGCPLSVITTMLGITIGLTTTLAISSNIDQNIESKHLPALPLPIVLGTLGHVLGHLANNTFQQLYMGEGEEGLIRFIP